MSGLKQILLFFLLLLPGLIPAQQFWLGAHRALTLIPSDTSSTWRIPGKKGFLYLTAVGREPFGARPFQVRLYNEERPDSVAQFPVYPNPTDTLWSFPIRFDTAGKYHVDLLFPDSSLRSRDFEVIEGNTFPTRNLYLGSNMKICTAVLKGEPVEVDSVYTLENGSRNLFLWLKHPDKLGTRRLILDIWQKNSESLIKSTKFVVDPQWKFVKIPLQFGRAGEYKLRLYDGFEVWIGELDLRIRE